MWKWLRQRKLSEKTSSSLEHPIEKRVAFASSSVSMNLILSVHDKLSPTWESEAAQPNDKNMTSFSKYTNPTPKPLMSKGGFILPCICSLLDFFYISCLFRAQQFVKWWFSEIKWITDLFWQQHHEVGGVYVHFLQQRQLRYRVIRWFA